MLLVSSDQLRQLVPMADAIAAMRDAFTRVVQGTVDDPPRVGLKDGSALAMLARGNATSGTAVKLISVRSGNRERGLPNIHALVTWLDGATGQPKFLIDGTAVTALRTGAASGVATDVLAAGDSSVLAMIGAGGQASDQIRAICAVRPIEEIRIVSQTGTTAEALAQVMASELPGVRLRAVRTIAEATASADVVCCATNSTEPVLTGDHLGGRVHVNAIGSYRPDMRELAPEALAQASMLVVDDVAATMLEAGEIIDAVASGAIAQPAIIELGQLLLQPPADVQGLTIFKSVGIAVQDWGIAQLLSERLELEEAPVVALVDGPTRRTEPA